MRVFADTSAWLATEIRNDLNYKKAITHKAFLQRERAQVLTNDYVMAETYTRLIYDKHFKAAADFHQKVKKGAKEGILIILEVDSSQRERAWEELKRYSDHKLSFTDATIIVHFKQYKLDEIFTFDRHFRDINLPTNL